LRRVCPYCGHEIEVTVHVSVKRTYQDLGQLKVKMERIARARGLRDYATTEQLTRWIEEARAKRRVS